MRNKIGKLILIVLVIVLVVVGAAWRFFASGDELTETVQKLDTTEEEVNTNETNSHPYLSEQQEVMLETFGIDVETVPTELTEEQQQCAVEAFGEERVQELLDGSAPTLGDFLKGRECF